MFKLWDFFLTRRAFTILTIGALLASGLYALIAMPKESTPEIVIPMGIVTTVLPGATAADVERLVTDKLEPAVRNVANIDKVTSTSRSGVSVITAQFLSSADIDVALGDLRTAVDGVRGELPSDAETPTVSKVDFQNQPVLMVGVSTDLSPTTLAKLGEDLQDDLISISGVSRVEVSGIRSREINIILHKDALARHNIRAEQVAAALRAGNTSVPAGSLTIDGIDYPVQFEGNIESVEEVAAIPVSTPSGPVALGNIATIVDGFEKPSSISRLSENGSELTYALTLNIYKSSGGNILTTTENTLNRIDELQETLLKGSDTVIIYDAGDEIRKSINELAHTGMETIVLVLLVLLVAIGAREALVAALAIPLSFVIAFLGMWATGNSINFISLFALIIAIGILVDSAIVVVEAIHTNRERGLAKIEAARKALQDFSWPLIAGTMTTVAVFVPLFFLTGIIGQFIKSIPFTIIVVLLASIVVALGFTPITALALLKHEESRFAVYREKLWENLAKYYRAQMEHLLSSKKWQRVFFGFLAASFIFALSLPITGLLKSVMFPPGDVDLAYVEIELPQSTTLSATDAAVRVVETEVAKTPHLSSFMTTVGSGSLFNPSGAGSGSKFANITLNLDPDRPSDVTSEEITNDLRRRLALSAVSNAKVTIATADGGPPSGAPIVVKVWGDDATSLSSATEAMAKLVEQTEGTRDISSSLSSDGTELRIAVDRSKAQDYGLSAADVASTLRAAIAGVDATTIRIDNEDVDVRLVMDLNEDFVNPEDTAIATADTVASVPISTPRGTVPLGSMLTITAGRTSSSINHEDGRRVSQVSAYVSDGANPVEVTNAIKSQAELQHWPDGTNLTYGGEDEEIKRTFTEMLVALVAGLVLMFGVLVLEFNSFRTSLRLLSAIPLSLTGVLIGLFIAGQALSFTAFLGIIALGGVLINHGILLLDVLNHLRAEHRLQDPKDLVLTASQSRLRPILLTTVTTMIGMIPLTLVSEMWAPLAFTVAFGLVYGTLLTLIFIPLLSYRRLVKEQSKLLS
jgi:HAE1 family hydrophobic/amphiphilic exporter-1